MLLLNNTTGHFNATSPWEKASHDLSLEAYRLTAAVGGTLMNSILFYLLVRDRKLCTAFNVYLLNILFWNILHAVIVYPLRAFHTVSNTTWHLRTFSCGLYLYGAWAGNAVLLKIHSLITVNRLWAVIRPLSYRTYHGTKMARILSATAVIWETVAFLPGFTANFLVNPVTDHCAIQDRILPIWYFFYTFTAYLAPVVVVTLGYVFVLSKYCAQQRVRPRESDAISERTTADMVRAFKRTISEIEEARNLAREAARYRSIALLTASSLCVYVSWMPTLILDFRISLVDGYHEDSVSYRFRTVLGTVQPLLDPVLLLIGLSDLRLALCRAVGESSKRLFSRQPAKCGKY